PCVDNLANGHNGDKSESGMATPVTSPGTSYWSITEGSDHPPLLSLVTRPAENKPEAQRASRPSLSRIPGRDHRRYYHRYWRSEYLMDFDPQRHGMICMVCGSSLATLKLSTIKRHIRQKHPYSLLWSAADKEVIRSGWESHLNHEGGQRSYSSGSGPSPHTDDDPAHLGQRGDPHQPPYHLLKLPASREEKQELPGPSAQTLERYLNDSLHAWFRQEFLMEYEAEAGRLLCMVCGTELPSLHLDHIKSHMLDTHPNSLVYSSEEKHCILQAWTIQVKAEVSPVGDVPLTQDIFFIGEDGVFGAPKQPAQPLRQPKRRRLRGGDPWRLRLDYLVAYGPQNQGTFCMVCSQVLHETKVSSFRRHIQEFHPETTTLSQQEREAMGSAGCCLPGVPVLWAIKDEGVSGGKTVATPPRHSHYPGKDQRRNYQVRWQADYLMDYDCRRHGLICMVCGATLATLKVSTIKRHIQQVHPHSLLYSAEEKEQALQNYNQTALHYVHFEDSNQNSVRDGGADP
uniref:Zinc finger translocation associated n=1 Tax=Nothobranchius furzeri TaxID=105023 RepID=A0A8C6KWE8_NOTFU